MTNQMNRMTKKSAQRVGTAAGACVVAVALWVGLGGSMGAAPVPADPLTCLPTCPIDGRSLVVAGDDNTTLSAQEITLGLSFTVANSPTGNFELYDGDAVATNWDVPFNDGDGNPANDPDAPELVVELFADPTGIGGSGLPLATWTPGAPIAGTEKGTFPTSNNGWLGVTFPHDAAALNGSIYQYAVHISPADPATDKGWNAFKIRAEGTMLLLGNQVVGFIGAMNIPGDVNTIYPAYPSLTPTPYDGTWTFHTLLPAGLNDVTIFDGDMDFGAENCSYNDTDDPDSVGIPAFAVGTAAVAEGVAQATGLPIVTNCTAPGVGIRTGLPADDNTGLAWQRLPGIVPNGIAYQLTSPPSVKYPTGQTFLNQNVSGNREWEQFKIQLVAPADAPVGNPCPNGGFAEDVGKGYAASDCRTDVLPGGAWDIELYGMDLSNLNFWFFSFKLEPPPPDGGGGVIAPTSETCQDYADGTILEENMMRYSLTGGNKIHNSVAPGVIFYFTEVTVGAGETLSVAQSHTGSAPIFGLHNDEARVYTTSCDNVSASVSFDSSTGTVTFGPLAPGTYILRLKWSGKSIVGEPAPNPPTSDYTFVAQLNGVPDPATANATPLSLVKK